ncbi:hypothetical protein LguiA_006010 [Lonicera macranthoides]
MLLNSTKVLLTFVGTYVFSLFILIPLVITNYKRTFLIHMNGRMQDNKAPSMISPTISLKSKDSPFSIPKSVTFEESSNSEFGHISTDSLICPSQKSSNTNIRSSNSFMGFDDHDWAKDQSDRSTITWAEGLKSDWTCLSMSIPMGSSDFSSSSNSPPPEKLALSPLSLTHEFDPIQLGEPAHKQTNWIPVSCRNSMGGPLGEVLNTTSTERGSKNSSALNLMTEVWDGGAHLGSSPTGVLQKASFVSLSNSSSGSSPRGEKNGPRGGSF